jgi:hypothetical protein
MKVFKDNISKHSDKAIAAEKRPSSKVMNHNDFVAAAAAAAAKANRRKLCDCSREPGKIVLDVGVHEFGCRFRKRLATRKFAENTSAIPHEISGGYGLAVALRGEDY